MASQSRFGWCALVLATLGLSAPFAQAQEQVSCLRRNVLVSVTDEQGRAPGGLTAENFRANFRGQPVQIISVEQKTILPRIVILLDTSGSMGSPEESQWKLATALAAHPAQAFHERAPIALVVFGDKVEVAVPFGQPRHAIISALASIRSRGAKGRTALFDAILKAIEMLQPGQPGDVIYIVSDAGESASRADRGDAERALIHSGARLFVAFVQGTTYRGITPEELSGPDNLLNLVRLSSGSWLSNTSSILRGVGTGLTKEQISASANRLYREMWDLYELKVALPAEVDKPREWKLELVSSPGISTRNLRLNYPRKLLPCPVPASQPKN